MSDDRQVKLSVVVPVYNAEATLAAQLEALAQQTWAHPWELVIANNRSSDGSMEIVEHYRPRLSNLRLVDASARQGQPYALNTGAEQARGESLAFCDADDEIAPGWVAAMGEALLLHDFVACRFDTDKLNEVWVRAIHRNPQANGLQKYDPPFLLHAGGGGLGVKRYIHQEVGGFDEAFPLLHDTDFCFKVQLRGYRLEFVPDAVLHVRYRHSLKGIYRQASGYAEYNVRLYKRYRALGMPPVDWRSSLPIWRYLLKQAFRIRSKSEWASWLWQMGYRVGRLQGSLRHRVLAL